MKGQKVVHKPTGREGKQVDDFPTMFGTGAAVEVRFGDLEPEWVNVEDLVSLDDLVRARKHWIRARAAVEHFQTYGGPDDLDELEFAEQEAWDEYGVIAELFGLCQQPGCPRKSDRAYCETHTPYKVED